VQLHTGGRCGVLPKNTLEMTTPDAASYLEFRLCMCCLILEGFRVTAIGLWARLFCFCTVPTRLAPYLMGLLPPTSRGLKLLLRYSQQHVMCMGVRFAEKAREEELYWGSESPRFPGALNSDCVYSTVLLFRLLVDKMLLILIKTA
jgi:hypothetical protein